MRLKFVNAAALVAIVAGCGAANEPPQIATRAPTSCDPAHLDVCERQIAEARRDGATDRASVRGYVEARKSVDPNDGWAALFDDLDRGAEPVAIVALTSDGEARARSAAAKLGARAAMFRGKKLDPPSAISADDLVVAMADVTKRTMVVLVDGGAREAYARDPVAQFFVGVAPVARAASDLSKLESDVAIDDALRAAWAAASEWRYVDAAAATDRLDALLSARDPSEEPMLRARFAANPLWSAGVTLEREGAGFTDDSAPASNVAVTPPSPSDTPFGDFLRVRLAKDDRAAWKVRGEHVLSAVAPDRRDEVAAAYAQPGRCGEGARPPQFEGARDLFFAYRLPGSLAPDDATPSDIAAKGLLALPEWMKRYELFVREVDRQKLGFVFAPTLLLQRGASHGMSPAGTPLFKHVTDLGVKHLVAARDLEASAPARFRPLSQLSFVYNAGAVADDAVRSELTKLTESAVQDKLARAKDAEQIASGLFAGVLSGMTYPPAIQASYYLALQGAAAAKLHGDLTTKTGWGVAGLYALDAVFRVASDQAPNPDFSAQQIARALEGEPSLEQPGLGRLAVAAARYAALGFEKKLNANVTKPEQFTPDRKAALDALSDAIGKLGTGDDVAHNVQGDVALLADGLIATLSRSLAEPAKAPDPKVCSAKTKAEIAPEKRRAVSKLADVRRRILASPHFKNGDGLWVRRTRLLVLLLSDAVDVAGAEPGKRLALTISRKDAETYADDALREWKERDAAKALAGLYMLVRGAISAKDSDEFLAKSGKETRDVVRGLLAFFRSERDGSSGSALLDTLAKLAPGGGDDLGSTLLSYAKAFYAANKPDQGDLWLLGSLIMDGVGQKLPTKDALDLAAAHETNVGWVFKFLSETSKTRRGAIPDPSVYAADITRVATDLCAASGADDVLTVMKAVHDFEGGKRAAAKATLDAFLEKAEAKGTFVPKVVFKYEEKTATKVFQATMGVSLGAGILSGANAFQVGMGLRTKGEPSGELTVKIDPPDTPQSGEEAARLYVIAAAIDAGYHFADGELERAASASRRAIAAAIGGARLGKHVLKPSKPSSFSSDARPMLALDAQLAADAKLPLLAGDLWTVVRAAYGEDADDATVAADLHGALFGLGGAEMKPAIDRAAKSLRVVAEPLPCTDAKVELGAYAEPACDAYSTALGLRVADVLKKLPRMKRGSDASAGCAELKSLDAFLGAADAGRYEPDLFTRAVEDLAKAHKSYDAAVLLTRQRRPDHCSAALVADARALASSDVVGPAVAADLLTVAVNCTGTNDARAIDDLVALDDATKALPDPTRALSLLTTVTALAARGENWDVVLRLSSAPDFVDRWLDIQPVAAATALLVREAARAATGAPPESDKGAATYALLCETFAPDPNRAPMCEALKVMRDPKSPPAARKKAASDALEKLFTKKP